MADLLNSDLDNIALVRQLGDLAYQNPSEFKQLSALWTPALLERDPHFFLTFIQENYQHEASLTEKILKAIADELMVFRVFYQYVATKEHWNADVVALAKNAPNSEAIIKGIELRQGNWAVATEATLLALFERDPDLITKHFSDELEGRQRRFSLEQGNFRELRQRLNQTKGNETFSKKLFRLFASQEEWNAKVREIIKTANFENIYSELTSYQPKGDYQFYRHDDDLSPELIHQLIEKFPMKPVLDYLEKYIPWFRRQMIRSHLETPVKDDEELLYQFAELRSKMGWYELERYADVWAIPFYERGLLERVIHNSYQIQNIPKSTQKELLARAKRDGHTKFYNLLAQTALTEAEWNNEILELVNSPLSDGHVERELERLRLHFKLSGATATALYHHNPKFLNFIWQGLGNKREQCTFLCYYFNSTADHENARCPIRTRVRRSRQDVKYPIVLDRQPHLGS